jgi:hypothetical protein
LLELELTIVVGEVAFGLFLVVGSFGLGEAAFAFTDLMGDEHGIDSVVVDDLGGVAVYLADFVVVKFHSIHDFNDFSPCLV